MSAVAAAIAVVATPFLLGLGILAVLRPRTRIQVLDAFGVAYPLGLLGIAVLTGVAIATGVRPSPALLIAVPAGAGTVAAAWRICRAAPPARLPGSSAGERAVFAGTVAIVALLLVDQMAVFDLEPITTGDEAWIWTLRGKFLHADWIASGDTPAAVLSNRRLTQPHYPLANPLVHAWIYGATGGVGHTLNRLPMHGLLLSILFFCAARLREVLRPAAAAACLLVFLPGADAARILFPAHADVLVAAAFVLALEAWRVVPRDRGAWRLFCVALALLAWSKQEGVLLIGCVACGCAAAMIRDARVRGAMRDLRAGLAWLCAPVAVLAVTWWMNQRGGHVNDLLAGGAGRTALLPGFFSQVGTRGFPALSFLVREVVFSAGVLKFALVPFLVVVVLDPGRAFAARRVAATVAMLLAAAGYWFVFVGMYRDLLWQLECAAERVFVHLWPALILWGARVAAELFPRLAAPVGADPGYDASDAHPTP